MKHLKLFMAFAAVAMFAACGGDDDTTNNGGGNNGGDNGGNGGGNYPADVQVTDATSGEVKAGMADAITIEGNGFDDLMDMVQIGYEDETGEMRYADVNSMVCSIRKSRITLGVRIDEPYLDKTVKVYLDRMGYDKMPLTGDITFTMPTVAEGYIPDPAFRSFLSSNPHNCPAVAALFDAYGMLNPSAAAACQSWESKDGWTMDLAGCQAESLEGIELFTGIKPRPGDENVIVAAWDMPNVKKIDISNWKLAGFEFRLDRAAKLEELIGAPYVHTLSLNACGSLKKLDLSPCRALLRCWMTNIKTPVCTELDLRRDQSGTYADRPAAEGEFTYLQGDTSFVLADNCKIKMDSRFLGSHPVENGGNPSCWCDIYDAWKRGAIIEVYWWKDIERYLDTAPLYTEDPEAISPETMKEGETETRNKWKVTEPEE